MGDAHNRVAPSFRGPKHAIEEQHAASVDPTPLLADPGGVGGGTGDDALGSNPPSINWRHPFTSTRQYFVDLKGYFGWPFLTWLAIENCFISGGIFALVMALSLPLFKRLGVDASRQQLYNTLIFSPWAMKPFIGVFSDLLPTGGYNKRYIAVLSILVGFVGCATLLVVYHNNSVDIAIQEGEKAVTYFADIVVLCFTFMSFEASTLDILAEGKYSELMRVHPESGSSIISFKFGFALLGGMVTTSCVGPLSDAGMFHAMFWIALALSATPLYPTVAGWIPEKRRTADEDGMKSLSCKNCLLYDQKTYKERRDVFLVITLCGLAAPVLAAVTTYASLAVGLAVSAVMILAFVVATYLIFPRSFFMVFVAITLFSLDWISMASALGYYYTASEQCVPGGPNFDYTFYITVSGVISSVVNFCGVLLYQGCLSTWKFRPVLFLTITIGSAASIIDVIIIMRWNLVIGIPDKVFFLLGNTIFETLCGSLWAIGSSTIFAKIAPPGLESAVFAYTVGISNFCLMVSGLLGSGVIRWSGMVTTGTDCNFEALPYLIVICQILVPICIGIPATFLIPNVLQTDQLIDFEREEEWNLKAASVDKEEHDEQSVVV